MASFRKTNMQLSQARIATSGLGCVGRPFAVDAFGKPHDTIVIDVSAKRVGERRFKPDRTREIAALKRSVRRSYSSALHNIGLAMPDAPLCSAASARISNQTLQCACQTI